MGGVLDEPAQDLRDNICGLEQFNAMGWPQAREIARGLFLAATRSWPLEETEPRAYEHRGPRSHW